MNFDKLKDYRNKSSLEISYETMLHIMATNFLATASIQIITIEYL